MYNNGNSSKNVTGSSVVDGSLENADYADNEISGDKIDGGIISNFQSTGVDDRLSSTKALTFDANKRAMFGGTTTPACYNGSGGSKPFVVQSSDATTTVTNAENLLCVVNSDDTTNNMSGIGFGWTDTDENPHYLSASINTIMGSAVTGQYRSADLAVLTSSATNSAPSEKARFLASGGITFNGDTAAANSLSDYETGNWTPEFRGSTGSAGSSATTTYGATYTKIGNVVNVEFYGRWSDVGSWTGDLHLYGLPYAHEASTRSVGVSAGLKKVEMPDSLPFVPIMIAGNSHLHFNRQVSDLGAKAYAQTSYFDDALNEFVMSLTYRT